MTLTELFNSKGYNYYPTDKGTTHVYLDIYEKLFNTFKDEKINILEIGVREGGSIRLWHDYFTNATIYGYDISADANKEISKNWFIGKEIDTLINSEVNYIIKDSNLIKDDEFNNIPLSIIIDDGSHQLKDQLNTIKILYNQLIEGGMLIIEDVQDIDNQEFYFGLLGIPFEIIDLRHINNRYDDVLLLFKK